MRCRLSLVFALSACSMGPRATSFAPARDPHGVATTVMRGQTALVAELLAATDTALLVLNQRTEHLVLIPYGAASRVSFARLPEAYTLRGGRAPTATTLADLRLWSRYPGGVDGSLLRRLLTAYGQDSLVVLAPCAPTGC